MGVSGFTSSVDVAASDENHPGYPLCLGYLQSVNRVLKNIRGAWWILSLAQEDNEKNLAHEQHLAPPGICFATLLIAYQCRLLYAEWLQGPNLTNLLIGELLRFRKEFMADIESMFYQVMIPQNERSFLRFLWCPDANGNNEIGEYEMCAHVFGTVSSLACANFVLKKTADDNKYMFGNPVADA